MSGSLGKYVLPAGALLVAAVFAFGVYLPESRHLRRIRAETESLRAELAGRAASLAVRTTSADAGDPQNVVSFDEALPAGPHLGEFLEGLDEWARAAGLQDHNIVPGAAQDGESVSWLPLTMDFHGDFSAVYGFIQKIESQPRLARVQRLELTTTVASGNELSSSVTMHVYFRRS